MPSHAAIIIIKVPLVAHADKVVGELLDGVCCRPGLNGLGVVSDEDGLLGLDDDDALFALRSVSTLLNSPKEKKEDVMRTFFPYRLLSSAFMTTYLSPPTCTPFA